MTGNHMAHPLLISLANIDASVRSKTSLHGYLLLGLLPIAKFLHKNSCICSLMQDQLTHEVLDKILSPLKTAATVGVMMNDPTGNLRYCFTPLASWIADTPEESLLAGTSPKASPVTTATSKEFGDPFHHPACTAAVTLAVIQSACDECSPLDYKEFLKIIKRLGLNGVVELFWKTYPLSDPSQFLTPEVLHHFHRFFWDHDVKWCVTAVGAAELDFRFSLLQTAVGYRAFADGISSLKQVTGCDHHAVQQYIVGVIAGSVPRQFLITIQALLDFRYKAQAPVFTDHSLSDLANSLQEFHDHKDAIVQVGTRKDSWAIPKLELLQSIIPSIQLSGPIMQWSADITEHAHVQEIKVPARAGNNQNYYSQIVRHLDCSEKCFCFDLATHLYSRVSNMNQNDEDEDFERDDKHEPNSEDLSLANSMMALRPVTDYFAIADALQRGHIPTAIKPYCTFSTRTTAFHLATKPSYSLSIDNAAAMFKIPDFRQALFAYYHCLEDGAPHVVSGNRTEHNVILPFDRVQVWQKIRVQQMQYYNNTVPNTPQTLRAIPPSTSHPHGLYDATVVNAESQSNWPKCGLDGTFASVVSIYLTNQLSHQQVISLSSYECSFARFTPTIF